MLWVSKTSSKYCHTHSVRDIVLNVRLGTSPNIDNDLKKKSMYLFYMTETVKLIFVNTYGFREQINWMYTIS